MALATEQGSTMLTAHVHMQMYVAAFRAELQCRCYCIRPSSQATSHQQTPFYLFLRLVSTSVLSLADCLTSQPSYYFTKPEHLG